MWGSLSLLISPHDISQGKGGEECCQGHDKDHNRIGCIIKDPTPLCNLCKYQPHLAPRDHGNPCRQFPVPSSFDPYAAHHLCDNGDHSQHSGKSPEGTRSDLDDSEVDRYPHHNKKERNEEVYDRLHALFDLFSHVVAIVVYGRTQGEEKASCQCDPGCKGAQYLGGAD